MFKKGLCVLVITIGLLTISACISMSQSEQISNEEETEKMNLADVITKSNAEAKSEEETESEAETKSDVEIESDTVKIVLNRELLQYKEITYGMFKENTGIDAEFYHGNYYGALIPEREIELIFEGKWNEELAMASLEENDKCLRFQGKLGSMMTGLTDEMDVDEFINGLAFESETIPNYYVEDGAGTAYYVANHYMVVSFDADNNDANSVVLEISLDESEKIGPDSYAWLYWRTEE